MSEYRSLSEEVEAYDESKSTRQTVFRLLRENKNLTFTQLRDKMPNANPNSIRQYIHQYRRHEADKPLHRLPRRKHKLYGKKKTKPTKTYQRKCENCRKPTTSRLCDECTYNRGRVFELDMLSWSWTPKQTEKP